MKTISLLIVLFIIGVLLASCAEATPEPVSTEGVIHFGDTVNGMTFNHIDEPKGESFFEMDTYCGGFPEGNPGFQEYWERSCQANQGDRVWFNCVGVYADSLEELDESWQAHDFRITVDDQPVDLASFGTVDMTATWDNQVTVRLWNVEIENLTAGQHEIVCELDHEGEHSESHWFFDVQEEAKALDTLPAEAIPGQHAYTSEDAGLDFLLYVPEAYGQDPAHQWPLILYLHGFVDGLQSIDQLRGEPLPTKLEQEADFPFIVVSPLRTSGRGDIKYWFREEHTAPLFQLVEEVSTLYSVDPDRIILHGGSAGGNGTWEIGIQYPDRFAALVPVMGYFGYPFEVPDNICDLKDVPIWAFHGALDERVPLIAEQSLVDAVNDCGGQAQITVIPDIGHDLEAEHVYTPGVIEWLLSQSLK